MGDKDAAVTLDSAWYVALLVGFEACSASCTARALATCPFVCVVAAWELVGGVACALPFWAVGARAPRSRNLQQRSLVNLMVHR